MMQIENLLKGEIDCAKRLGDYEYDVEVYVVVCAENTEQHDDINENMLYLKIKK